MTSVFEYRLRTSIVFINDLVQFFFGLKIVKLDLFSFSFVSDDMYHTKSETKEREIELV